jgi:hypothetical protein
MVAVPDLPPGLLSLRVCVCGHCCLFQRMKHAFSDSKAIDITSFIKVTPAKQGCVVTYSPLHICGHVSDSSPTHITQIKKKPTDFELILTKCHMRADM